VLGRVITSFHMPMFFIVAGYFTKTPVSRQEIGPSVRKFARRLLPAFVFTQVALILWAVLMHLTKGEGWDSVLRQTLSLFWADPHGPETPWGRLSLGVIWFLAALFISKSILLCMTGLKSWAIPLSLLPAVAAVLLHKVFPYSIWCISLTMTALPFVTLGWWLRTHPLPIWAQLICIAGWIAAIIWSNLDMYGFIWKCYPLDFIGACGGTFCLYWLSRLLNRYLKPLSAILSVLGIWSLAIMCFHNLEIDCHLGNHVMALFPFTFPVWGKYLFRYLLTIAMAAAAVKLPVLKKIFA